MLSEQQVLEAAPPKTPLQLLRDRTVRWQLITVYTICMCNQLSGMNTVRSDLNSVIYAVQNTSVFKYYHTGLYHDVLFCPIMLYCNVVVSSCIVWWTNISHHGVTITKHVFHWEQFFKLLTSAVHLHIRYADVHCNLFPSQCHSAWTGTTRVGFRIHETSQRWIYLHEWAFKNSDINLWHNGKYLSFMCSCMKCFQVLYHTSKPAVLLTLSRFNVL